jgi:hypothetical protein
MIICPDLKPLFRKSLHTRSRRDAESQAKRWWFIMDEPEKRFFSSPEIYGKAIELLSRYKNVEHLPRNQVEELLITLKDDEAAPLEKAIELKKVQLKQLNHPCNLS